MHILLTFSVFSLLNLNWPIGAYISDINRSVLIHVKGKTVSNNIAHNILGHCYVLTTGSKTGNSFLFNFDAVILNRPIGKLMSMIDTDQVILGQRIS
jgi:hypothetical protein